MCSTARCMTHSSSARTSAVVGSSSRVPSSRANSHGLPSAPRASMTASQPVWWKACSIDAVSFIPPLRITGAPSVWTSSRASSRSGEPLWCTCAERG